MEKYENAIDFLQKNQKKILDKPFLYEKLIYLGSKLNRPELVIENTLKVIEYNTENLNYYLDYFKAKGVSEPLNSIQDLVLSKDKNLLYKSLEEIKSKVTKSKLITRVELAIANEEDFPSRIAKFIVFNIKQSIPSIFKNIKFIYDTDKSKIPIIEKIIMTHINSISETGKLSNIFLTEGNETQTLNLVHQISWVYYLAALHFDYLRNSEEALKYIDLAIDDTNSVVEFYMLKSKILKHSFMLPESIIAYEKVLNYKNRQES